MGAMAQVDSTTAVQQIQDRLDIYFQANEEKDFDTVLDMVYPKLFTIAPRDLMKQQFTSLEAQGISFEIRDMSANSFSAPFAHGEEQFVLIGYAHSMDMMMTDSSTQSSADMMLPFFEMQYGEDNVTYDSTAYTFTIAVDKVMLAVAPLDSKEWAFVDFSPEKPMVLDMLFDKAVVEHFLKE